MLLLFSLISSFCLYFTSIQTVSSWYLAETTMLTVDLNINEQIKIAPLSTPLNIV